MALPEKDPQDKDQLCVCVFFFLWQLFFLIHSCIYIYEKKISTDTVGCLKHPKYGVVNHP